MSEYRPPRMSAGQTIWAALMFVVAATCLTLWFVLSLVGR